MQHLLDRISSPLNWFELTRGESPKLMEPQTEPLVDQLRHAGLFRLRAVLDRAEADEFHLRSTDLSGNPDIYQQHLRGFVTSFFGTSDDTVTFCYPDHLMRGEGGCAVDVRRIGVVRSSPNGPESTLFWAAGASRPDRAIAKQAADRRRCSPQDVADSLLPVIPASAGLSPFSAMSLANPLLHASREFVITGTAGAVFSYTPDTFGIQAELSWSPKAFVGSLNTLQQIGRELNASDAIHRAVERGTGILNLDRSSALLAKAYEAVARVGRLHEQPFVVAGLFGVAVLPIPRQQNQYFIHMGVIGHRIEEIADAQPTQQQLNIEPVMAVVRLKVTRNEFGFVSMTSDLVNAFAPREIEWHSDLPEIHDPTERKSAN